MFHDVRAFLRPLATVIIIMLFSSSSSSEEEKPTPHFNDFPEMLGNNKLSVLRQGVKRFLALRRAETNNLADEILELGYLVICPAFFDVRARFFLNQ